MKVKLKTSLIGTSHRAGHIVDLPDNTAKRLIKENLAVYIEDNVENKKDSKVNVENRQRQRKRTTKRRTSKNTSKG